MKISEIIDVFSKAEIKEMLFSKFNTDKSNADDETKKIITKIINNIYKSIDDLETQFSDLADMLEKKTDETIKKIKPTHSKKFKKIIDLCKAYRAYDTTSDILLIKCEDGKFRTFMYPDYEKYTTSTKFIELVMEADLNDTELNEYQNISINKETIETLSITKKADLVENEYENCIDYNIVYGLDDKISFDKFIISDYETIDVTKNESIQYISDEFFLDADPTIFVTTSSHTKQIGLGLIEKTNMGNLVAIITEKNNVKYIGSIMTIS